MRAVMTREKVEDIKDGIKMALSVITLSITFITVACVAFLGGGALLALGALFAYAVR